MELSHEGLSLWYGTADAPAPAEQNCERLRPSLTVGVRPPSPANVVTVRYREDGGLVKSIPALPLASKENRQAQYFRALFPSFPHGNVVDYAPILSCAGRSLGAAVAPGVGAPWSSFRLAPPAAPASFPRDSTAAGHPAAPRFSVDLDYVTHLTATLDRPEMIGAVPVGLKMNYYLSGGTARGPRLNGRLRPRGGDNMIVTPDGVGNVSVNCVVQTDEGALVAMQFSGVADFGMDGYAKAAAGVLPARPRVQIAIRCATAHPGHVWMNRRLFVGVGEVSTADLLVDYDIFAVGGGGRAAAGRGACGLV